MWHEPSKYFFLGQRRTQAEIQQLLNDYQQRGELSRQAFCASRGIPLHSPLDYYRRRYATPASVFAQVEVKASETRRFYALVLANGRRIECDQADLPTLIRGAESV